MTWARVCGVRWVALACLAFVLGAAPARAEDVLVFATASFKEALDEATESYRKSGGGAVRLSYAASSALAQQIKAGAPADIFISADRDWMDDLARAGVIMNDSRRNLVGNRLVLVAPAGSAVSLVIGRDAPLAAALGERRLCMADPDHVPAGRYGRRALQHLGLWSSVESRLSRAENVRHALAFVAQGECALGVVYATDAKVETKVRVVSVFPTDSHPPIIYPVALTRTARAAARPFHAFLHGQVARAIFEKHGFTKPD